MKEKLQGTIEEQKRGRDYWSKWLLRFFFFFINHCFF
jgi:hypothetical protein